MPTALMIRPLATELAGTISDLVVRVFDECIAPHYGPEGVASFHGFAAPEAFAARMEAGHLFLGALLDEELVGMLEYQEGPHIVLMFVDMEQQFRGIGRAMLDVAVTRCRYLHPDVDAITINAMPGSRSIFRHFGFEQTDEETEQAGVRFTPMAMPLSAT